MTTNLETLMANGDPWISGYFAIAVALISAGISVFTLYRTHANQASLAKSNARLDYEYEARKRLYEECDPLWFQLSELAVNAHSRILSLARTAREGNLDRDRSWLNDSGYYMRSTVYKLFAPLTIYKLLQGRLTFLDLSLAPGVQIRYQILKLLYLSFTEDFSVARSEPGLAYNPNVSDWKERRDRDEAVHWRQGLPIGRLDAAVDCLMTTDSQGENGNRARLMSFGEFEDALGSDERTQELCRLVIDTFVGFHPERRPVLWRILLAQASYYELLHKVMESEIESLEAAKDCVAISAATREKLDWRQNPGQSRGTQTEFEVAEAFTLDSLKPYFDSSESEKIPSA